MQEQHNKKDFKKDFNKKPFRKKHNRADFYIPGNPDGVRVPDDEFFTLEKALKYLKRQLKDSDKLLIAKERSRYIKPTEKRKKKMEKARAMQQRHDMMEKRNAKNYPSWLIMTSKGAQ
jgi:ribosomal protein S21